MEKLKVGKLFSIVMALMLLVQADQLELVPVAVRAMDTEAMLTSTKLVTATGPAINNYGCCEGESSSSVNCNISMNSFDSMESPQNIALSENWTRQFGCDSYDSFKQHGKGDSANGVAVSGDGNAYVAGITEGTFDGQTTANYDDAFICRYSNTGDLVWLRQFGGPGNEKTAKVALDNQGNVLVAGYTDAYITGQPDYGNGDVFLRKYDSSGAEIWTREIGSKGTDEFTGLAVDAENNVIVSGLCDGPLFGSDYNGYCDIFICKYNPSGELSWHDQFGQGVQRAGSGLSVDNLDNIYIGGSIIGMLPDQEKTGALDAFVSKYSKGGSRQWIRQFGITARSVVTYSVSAGRNDGVYVVGCADAAFPGQTAYGGQDGFIRKYNVSGDLAWTHQFGTGGNDIVNGSAVDANNNIYVTGYTEGAFPGQTYGGGWADCFVYIVNSSGETPRAIQFGTDSWDLALDIAVSTLGHLYAVGSTGGTLQGQVNHGNADAFIRRYNLVTPQPPTCSLTLDKTAGIVPLTVTFTLSACDSYGSVTAWALDVNGDGVDEYSGSGTPQSTLSYKYSATGSYEVIFMVTDNTGTTSASAIKTINVTAANQSPTCSLSVNKLSGITPLAVTFTLTASDPDGTIATWMLDVNGDGVAEYKGNTSSGFKA